MNLNTLEDSDFACPSRGIHNRQQRGALSALSPILRTVRSTVPPLARVRRKVKCARECFSLADSVDGVVVGAGGTAYSLSSGAAHEARDAQHSSRGFFTNVRPACEGRLWRGRRIERLLLNSQMVQGIFNGLNLDTRGRRKYYDGHRGPDRHTREFIAAMPIWQARGIRSESGAWRTKSAPGRHFATSRSCSTRTIIAILIGRTATCLPHGIATRAGVMLIIYRRPQEPCCNGFQGVPVDRTNHASRKRVFFDLVCEITGAEP